MARPKSRSKYVTLSTGYKVDMREKDAGEHLLNSIFGECLVDIKRHLQPTDLDRFNDQLMNRILEECSYVSKRYGIIYWRLASAVLGKLVGAVADMEASVDENEDCKDCEHKDYCKLRGGHKAPCSENQLN